MKNEDISTYSFEAITLVFDSRVKLDRSLIHGLVLASYFSEKEKKK